jgi:hypothetical protein
VDRFIQSLKHVSPRKKLTAILLCRDNQRKPHASDYCIERCSTSRLLRSIAASTRNLLINHTFYNVDRGIRWDLKNQPPG